MAKAEIQFGNSDLPAIVKQRRIQKSNRRAIMRLENYLLQFPQADLPVQHYWAKGMYCRVLPIPKGTLLTGRIHKCEHLAFFISGDMSVWEDGVVKRLNEFKVFTSPPGAKRAGYAHEDSIFMCVFTTDKGPGDEDEMLDEFSFLTYKEYDDFVNEVSKW